jgi:hypothetical protein
MISWEPETDGLLSLCNSVTRCLLWFKSSEQPKFRLLVRHIVGLLQRIPDAQPSPATFKIRVTNQVQ